MTASDLDVLLEMGFDKTKAELAVQKSGGLQGALEWLEEVQDKSMEDINAATSATSEDPTAEPPALNPGEVAHSLVCNECSKKFRSEAQASFHAEKSGHTDFAESTEEIALLTEEEKKAKLAELRERLAEKRGVMSEQDKADKKKNEDIRRKSTKETKDIQEELQKKEQIKEAAAKRREKLADIAVKEKIKAQIATDKEERRIKAEREKAERAGQALPAVTAAGPISSEPVISKPASAYKETRLRLQTPGGNIQKAFPVETTLFEVAAFLNAENGFEAQSFIQNFPKKTFDEVDFGATLKELGLVPSASLIVK